jgi:hypothetical protein
MQVEGNYTINAPRARVWATLLDPEVLASTLPGCDEFKALGDGRYEATLTVGVANVKGTYKSLVTLADTNEPDSYRMLVDGGGKLGSIKGEGLIQLSDAAEGTFISYAGTVQVTGTVARVAQRMLPSVAKMMIGQFFKSMEGKIAEGA